MFHINSKLDLYKLANMVNLDEIDYIEAKLECDLIFSEPDITPSIGTMDFPFTGVFDGNNHSVTFDITNPPRQHASIFNYVDNGGIIKNLTMKGMIDETALVGSLNCGHLLNCRNEAIINIDAGAHYGKFGGLCKYARFSEIKDCVNKGQFIVLSKGMRTPASLGTIEYLGGLVGSADKCKIEKCDNFSDLFFSEKITIANYIGGIVGRSFHTNVRDCKNYGSLRVEKANTIKNIGGIIGFNKLYGTMFDHNRCFITDCTNYGDIIFKDHEERIMNCGDYAQPRVGGITYRNPDHKNYNTYKNCTNLGHLRVDTCFVDFLGTNRDLVSYTNNQDPVAFAFKTKNMEIIKEKLADISDPKRINTYGNNILLELMADIEWWNKDSNLFEEILYDLAKRGVDFSYQNKFTGESAPAFLLDPDNPKRVLRGFKRSLAFIKEKIKEEQEQQQEEIDNFSTIGF